ELPHRYVRALCNQGSRNRDHVRKGARTPRHQEGADPRSGRPPLDVDRRSGSHGGRILGPESHPRIRARRARLHVRLVPGGPVTERARLLAGLRGMVIGVSGPNSVGYRAAAGLREFGADVAMTAREARLPALAPTASELGCELLGLDAN